MTIIAVSFYFSVSVASSGGYSDVSSEYYFKILRKHAHEIYREFFQKQKLKISLEKIGSNIFAQNIDCGYTLEPPRRVPTIYVLDQKIRKICIPL